ncbi:Hsp20/alpha crystallin family protein [candidate division KSB1 bacterium]|nr:Hsp20/alpha crystallin family protein [candidate division KSB1 bacterium]
MLPILRRAERELFDLHSGVNRLLNDFWRSDVPGFFASEGQNLLAWSPKADLEETGDAFIVHTDLPGLKKGDVKVTLHNQVLTISGERKSESEKKMKNFHRVERTYGSFQRSFSLPGAVESEAVTADYKDGVLTITVPKSEASKPKEISIN